MNRKLILSLNLLNRLKITKCRLYSTKKEGNDISKLRNIGILAHIDAGTTL